MRHINHAARVVVGLLMLVLVVGLTKSSLASDRGLTWQVPIDISADQQPFIHYAKLYTTGDAVYYRVTVSAPSSIRFEVSTSRSATSKFAPQVVLFQPNDTTVGPILPVEQPPQTIALVYPITQPRESFDAFTQTVSSVRLEARPVFYIPGTYTFAIYNAGSSGGQFKFTLVQGTSNAVWQDAWQMPYRWWQDQTFAGFSWLTLITPLLLGLCVWSVYLRLDHHRLHVHKTYAKKTIKKRRS